MATGRVHTTTEVIYNRRVVVHKEEVTETLESVLLDAAIEDEPTLSK